MKHRPELVWNLFAHGWRLVENHHPFNVYAYISDSDLIYRVTIENDEPTPFASLYMAKKYAFNVVKARLIFRQ